MQLLFVYFSLYSLSNNFAVRVPGLRGKMMVGVLIVLGGFGTMEGWDG